MFGKTKDPVCGMMVAQKTATAISQHKGKVFYFCSKACKEKFDQNPSKYTKM